MIMAIWQKVIKVTQSPMNPTRWYLDLECGHSIWVTKHNRPRIRGLGTYRGRCPRCEDEAELKRKVK